MFDDLEIEAAPKLVRNEFGNSKSNSSNESSNSLEAISPLLSVSQLRSRGVTLHLMISSEREPIPDVPAIYFVEPSRSNLQIIASDCAKGLYGTVYLNFVTKLERPLMKEFAKLIVQSNSLSNIASIHDLYLDYICLERFLKSQQTRELLCHQ